MDLSCVIFLVLFAFRPRIINGQAVGVVGLGGMGAAIVKCCDQHGFEVRAWNCGQALRNQVEKLGLQYVIVNDKLEDAKTSSDLIIMTIKAGNNLENVRNMVESIPAKSWEGKIIMQYLAHEPVAARNFEKVVASVGGNLIAGAMIAEPGDDCGNVEIYFVASSEKATIVKHRKTLEKMGPLVPFRPHIC